MYYPLSTAYWDIAIAGIFWIGNPQTFFSVHILEGYPMLVMALRVSKDYIVVKLLQVLLYIDHILNDIDHRTNSFAYW